MLKPFNDDNTDFSNEFIILMALVIEMQTASEMICYKLSRDLSNSGYKNTFFQNKKLAISQAKKHIDAAAAVINNGFDDIIQRMINKVQGQEAYTFDCVQHMALDTIRLLLEYHSRCDGDGAKQERVHKAIMNFKEIDKNRFDLNALLKYFNTNKISNL